MPLRLDRMAELEAALSGDALLLVPNYASSDQLVDQLCLYQRRVHPGTVLPRPAIRAIDLWLADLWEQLGNLHQADTLGWRILQPAEEQLLWQRLIRRTSPELLLLNQDGTAMAAANAWRLLQQWQIPLTELRQQLAAASADEQKDDREYAWSWLQAFEQHCQRQQLLTISGRLQQLLLFIENGTLSALGLLPATLLLSGFEAPPPLYQALFAAMAMQGTQVLEWRFSDCQPAMSRQLCSLPADECRAAASWAAEVLAQDPMACIGILTTDSSMLKGTLERCCAQVFAAKPGIFNSTLPAALTELPYVHVALASLSLLEDQCDILECCAILRSPWLLAADAEEDARAELELRLRRNRALCVYASDLREFCLQAERSWYSPQLGDALLNLRQDFLRQPARQTLQAWLLFFKHFWDTLLPRSTLLLSGKRTLVQGWEGLLKQAGASSSLFGPCNFGEARTLLSALGKASTMPSGRSQAPILLLTPMTAAGLHFTHLWCMQMTEGLWPGDQQPHPYLPLQLQQHYGLPGIDRNQVLQQGHELLEDLIRRTTVELVFSHALSDDDLPLRSSALLPAALPERSSEAGILPGNLHPALLLQDQQQLEQWQDPTHIPVPEGPPFQGGSGLLTSQSACPFKGFAQYRLQAQELPQPEFGIPAQALGTCVHEALHLFWRDMQTQAALLASDTETLERAVQAALEPPLQKLARMYPNVLTPTLQALESRRLSALLLCWLEVEKQRGAFTVLAGEETLAWTGSGLQLTMRVDRIDRHADGSSVVVDYKTGRTASIRWEDERPAAPQLLLYQQAVDTDIRFAPASALLYAGINVEQLDYSGIAADSAVYPGLDFVINKSVTQPDWQSLKQLWQHNISRLAAEFVEGYAAVQPTRSDSCTYCHLGSLCRIAELRQTLEEES